MLIQLLLIISICFILAHLISNFRTHKIGLFNFFGWICFWLIACFIILWPESVNFLARVFGVGRGADLIIYFSLVLIFYFIFLLGAKISRIEKDITKIVQNITIKKHEARSTKSETNSNDKNSKFGAFG